MKKIKSFLLAFLASSAVIAPNLTINMDVDLNLLFQEVYVRK